MPPVPVGGKFTLQNVPATPDPADQTVSRRTTKKPLDHRIEGLFFILRA
jgi:hypothetical protein